MTGTRRPAPSSLLRIRHQRWRVERSLPYAGSVVVDVTGAEAINRGRRASFVLPFEVCDPLPPLSPRRVTSRGWRRLVRRILAEAVPSPQSLLTAVHARFEPMAFQLEPALAYVRGDTARMLIADAVGLGKTIQAGLIIAEMLARRSDGRALVVVPGGLREQWRDELRVRFDINADVFDAAGLWRAAASLPAGMNPWQAPAVVITSIDFIKRPEVLRSLEPLVWDLVVFDEAHALSGRSDRRLAAAGLAVRGRAVVFLTATPHNGNQEDFDRLCGLGDIASRFPLTVFRRTRAELGDARSRRSFWIRLHPSGVEVALRAELVGYARRVWVEPSSPGARLAMLVLLKRAASSATALARSLERRRQLLSNQPQSPSMEEQLPLPLLSDDDEPTSELGAPGLSDREQELGTLDDLMGLARRASGLTHKLAALRRLLQRTTEPVIVFTEYRDTLDELLGTLSHVSLASIHGGMTTRERAWAARQFTHGSARVLVATDAASEGLNLQKRCRLVISFDLPWTPLRLEQRTGRVDRIGQTRRVHAWQMLAGGTYEEVVAERVRSRASIVSAAMQSLRPEEERDAAEAVLSGQREEADSAGTRSTVSLICATTGATAQAESRRIQSARALLVHASTAGTARPFYAHLRNGWARRLVFAFQVSFADPSGRHVWDTVAGSLARWSASGSLQVNRDVLLMTSDVSLMVAETAIPTSYEHLRLWRRAAAATLKRDRSIALVLRSDRARLSAALIQPELFSRRPDRSSSPQLQLLDESLEHLRRASQGAQAARQIDLESVSLLFAGGVPG